MEGVASEVSLKIRSAIKAKLVELGTYVDEELPDYIMVLVANKKTKDQMDDDLSLFLGHNTERFTSWLHHVLQKLNAAALLQGTATSSSDAARSKVTPPQEEVKKKDPEEEKRKEKEEEKKREREEEKKRLKLEETRKLKEEEKRKAKEKDKVERKRKSSERKGDKKEKKIKKSESPTSPEKTTKDKKPVSEVVKPKVKEASKEKEKPKPLKEEAPSTEKVTPVAPDVAPSEPSVKVSPKKIKPLVRGKISSADIFRAESQAGQKKEEEEDELQEDLLVLRADVDELGLELEDEPTPKKSKQEQPHRTVQLRTEGKEEGKAETKVATKSEAREKADHRGKTESREKGDNKEKSKSKSDAPAPRISAKERLGGIVAPKSGASRDKPSVLDRLGSSSGGKHMINLREESGGSVRSESSSTHSQGVARVVASAITSAHRSVCVLPPSNSSGKKLEARVRPLMSRQVESSHGGASRGVSGEAASTGSEERVRETSRPSSGRVVSAVGAVLKRPHTQAESDEEEYDPKKPGLSGVASKVEVTPRPRRPRAIQANTALILRAMADAHKSVNRPSHKSRDREKVEKQKSRKKHKGELFSRSYREREEAARPPKVSSEARAETQEAVTIRKIAITVPNATHKESEKQVKQEKKKEEEEEEEEEEVEMEVSVAIRPHVVPEPQIEVPKIEQKEEPMEAQEKEKTPVSDNDYGMEEVEEVEEEVIDEGIEEDQPPIQHAFPPLPVAGGENTKFIVTLEGVDSEGFPEKEEPLGIRSRLGVRPPPTDMEDQVEEYIEEVEEWEEEEEMPEEGMPSVVPVGGLVTGVKARLQKAATTQALLNLQPGGSKERCKYWPLCKAGEGCIYHHPTVTCKSFPSCKYGDKCLFIHPNCMYDAACTRVGCPYTHASSRNFAMVSANPTQHKAAAPVRAAKCKFFPKCTNLSCPFLHPKACYYGATCKTPSCPFTHPTVPMGAKLKWVAPKLSSQTPAPAATTTTTTIIATDSKEVDKKEDNLLIIK